MANITITGLTAATAGAGADVLPIDQSGTTKQLSITNLFATPTAIGSGTPASGAFTTLSATLSIAPSAASTTDGISASVTGTGTNDVTYIDSVVGVTTDSRTGTRTGATIGVRGEASTTGAGTFATLSGIKAYAGHGGSSTLASAYGVVAQTANTAAGTITDAIGLKINPATNGGGGVITNNYGIFVNNASVGGTINSALHIYNAGLHGKISWGNDANTVNFYMYLASSGTLSFNGNSTLDTAGNFFAAGAVAQKISTGTVTGNAVGNTTLFTIQNSKAITFNAGFGNLFKISFGGTGQSGLFWATYDSATITSLGSIPAGMNLGAPGATQLGITKSAGSSNVVLTSGSGLAAAQTNMSLTIIGNNLLSVTDWT